ncbi:MAG: hypothetical protein AAF719_03550 [Pseudomonadota bacterium]
MTNVSPGDLSALDKVWRALPEGHPWCGWAHVASDIDEIWVFRERANWRRFVLRKTFEGWTLFDDASVTLANLAKLEDAPDAIASAPSL